MVRRWALLLLMLMGFCVEMAAQGFIVSGRVTDQKTAEPIEFASILLKESELWAITDEHGRFEIRNVPAGKQNLTVQCLGYATNSTLLYIKKGMQPLAIELKQDNLQLDEVTVVAKRKEDAATTAYSIDRTTLDQQQLLNLGEISTLLPGGKSVNSTLMDDSRIALRSDTQEKGNAAFGTAIEIDGMRLDNNGETNETLSASTRTLSSANIESVEVVTGVPSVEYGDLSNGVVKVKTRRGKSPFIVEGKLNQHTRQVAVSKGFDLGRHNGMLNASLEHARSFSNIASPHTAYQRNILSLHYMNVFMRDRLPLTLNVGLTGNVGGYNSEADPDQELDDYTKVRDNNLRAHVDLEWLLNKPWVTSLELRGSYSMADKLTEDYASRSSSSTQPRLHALNEGYHIAQDYDVNPQADIILGPTGYWYEMGYNDAKPQSYSLKMKATWNKALTPVAGTSADSGEQSSRSAFSLSSHFLLGAELAGSHNAGRGTYYDDMRYAPSWREYRYDQLPWMNNLALYAEERLTLNTGRRSLAELTAGLRDDITMISGSDYGTVSSLSPRFNGRYVFWRGRKDAWMTDLSAHVGWGKSVKLPSFQVLYPRPTYTDLLAFSSTSTQDNRSYYAYYTRPSQAVYNPDLRWQYTLQTDFGLEFTIKGTRVSLSAFRHKTHRAYMATDRFTPFAYKYSPPSALQSCGITAENRLFDIDRQTGIVTVSDASGQMPPVELAYNERLTYTVNSQYVNASPVERQGVEWMVDFAQIKALLTQLRIDGNFYEYKGIDEMLFADIPLGTSSTMSGNRPYQYVGWYRGCNSTGTNYSATASVANGTVTRRTNLNATLTTHIPRIRMIVSLRLETSLQHYRRNLSELSDGTRGIVLEEAADLFGEPYDGTTQDKYIAVYPEYYTTWENPTELIPFAEKFAWARDNDRTLYNDLSRLIVRSNYPYVMNPNRLSRYCSANLSVTKEIGDHVSVSFYANNFFNNMSRVHSSQTNLETSLFGSSYIPSYYYGLSLRLKL
ncbi:MAG: TonB-dependent receptor [Prevotella sp.]|nr:TonB-dependent receptor [Prevotella sp.]